MLSMRLGVMKDARVMGSWILFCSFREPLRTGNVCKVAYKEWNQPKRVMFNADSKAGGAEPSKPFTSDVEPQDLMFALLGFVLPLVHCFLTVLSFLSFGMGIYILYMLEVYAF